MLENLGLIVALSGVVFAVRLTGFSLGQDRLPATLRHALRFTPIAVFTAIVVSTVGGRGDDAPLRLIAAVIAVAAATRARSIWLCIAVGLAALWLLRQAFG